MIQVVLDSNVMISAHLKGAGLEAAVFQLTLAGKVQLCVSKAILDEYEEVLRREKFHFDPRSVAHSLAQILKMSRRAEANHTLSVCPDPPDNRFLECAEAAAADYLVTGNKRHFPKQWGRTKVVNARELLEIITPELWHQGKRRERKET